MTPCRSSGSFPSFMATSPAETIVKENFSVETDNAAEPTYSVVSQDISLEAWEILDQIEDPMDSCERQEMEKGHSIRSFTTIASVGQPNPRPRKTKQPGQEDTSKR
ncbi:hypothetical protein PoB_002049400 [Plakobranchus ocellatus]|uniref:Uncharacterized protein n=1 Tax=Plakobranchus ocellatus TaxID=259542 RepID=A0AAV3ZF71_9GAST|nr:hypothetical protein PoB_002049400 [Plakobranchus ocellatus]